MAIIKRGILGGFSKKIGNVVGGSWKGIAYMRSLPLSVANPRSAGQVAQRTKFGVLVAIAQILLSGIIKPLMDRFAGQMSGFNFFIQQNIAAVSALGVVTWANLKISIGSLVPLKGVDLGATLFGGNYQLGWDDTGYAGNAQDTDTVFIAVYNETKDSWTLSSGTTTRADGGLSLPPVVAPETGDIVHAYFSARRADGSLVSNTEYSTVVMA